MKLTSPEDLLEFQMMQVRIARLEEDLDDLKDAAVLFVGFDHPFDNFPKQFSQKLRKLIGPGYPKWATAASSTSASGEH